MSIKKNILAFSVATIALSSSQLYAEDWEGEAKDAWVDGKIEASYLLNTELNNFKIDTEVENGVVMLTGEVPSETHKALAEEIVKNIEGVSSVNNNLMVGEADYEMDTADRDFSTRFFDMTTTVAIKSKYAINDELEALDINIDTKNGEVALRGEVSSEAEKMLAEEIAANMDHVTHVDNQLVIVPNA